ncbi:cytochrome aa3 quinol oxidase subunit IV [Bacillus sp. AFS076308]|uniref:cytochrome aa3 quinol oxidase subunit IV n=1 Tax=unclassified Bacillus (in: firmicutes) TaxID=185979 RepID=UPI000BF28474|nr:MULTISPECIES: cytochrome aa3 quinol oxidase subunit IV [unclassified Bacillus (in: firmicutes)]PFN97785.1 cytochrome aa3 quinol oxidase subunit IV [Bacillus sp. AFS076308]PGV51121.1 cytochrome aa3 quinol oxidase subunit IV [Bacillus sp. AFS037270]
MAKNTKGFPITHVLGFISSLVLTFAALFVALKTSLSFKTILWVIGSLAVIQAALQLFMFMHLNEGEDGKSNMINIASGVFIAFVAVAGSIWVMSFGM